MRYMTRTLFVLAIAGSAAAGCSQDEPASQTNYPQPAASQGDEATPSESTTTNTPGVTAESTPTTPAMVSPDTAPPGAAPSDGQIAKITDAVDSAEIAQAQLANSRSSNAGVKRFATHMIEDHTQSKQQASQLAAAAHITPAPSDDSNELEGKAAKVLERLHGASATAFDKEYMTAQVEQHQEVLASLSSKLIPSAKNPELKALLQKAKDMVEKHLAHAQELQRSL